MKITKETSDLAQQRYNIALQKYSLGTLSFTDFGNAQFDKDRAIIDYMNNLYKYWSSYYLIRKVTLYNLKENRKIEPSELLFSK